MRRECNKETRESKRWACSSSGCSCMVSERKGRGDKKLQDSSAFNGNKSLDNLPRHRESINDLLSGRSENYTPFLQRIDW